MPPGLDTLQCDTHAKRSVLRVPAFHPCADAGTDCVLGEVFNLEVPPGLDTLQCDTHAKRSVYGVPAFHPFADAGTDCALGEVFNLEVPPGFDSVQLEVHAKHTLTGDEHIGTATISLEALKVCLSDSTATLSDWHSWMNSCKPLTLV